MHWSEAEYAAYLARQGQAPPSAPALPTDTPEKTFLAQVRRLATDHGFATYHTFDSRKSDEGYPDLTLVKPGRLIFMELKSRRGKLTHDQEVWLSLLSRSVPGVETYHVRPEDWDRIVDILTRKDPTP